MEQISESRFVTSGWSLIPGPKQFQELFYSTALQEIATYPAHSIATAILGFNGTSLVQPAHPSWWSWRARWEQNTRFITLNMSLLKEGKATWGGSELETDCLVSDLLTLWITIRKSYPCVWLHSPTCRIYTETSFVEEHNFRRE